MLSPPLTLVKFPPNDCTLPCRGRTPFPPPSPEPQSRSVRGAGCGLPLAERRLGQRARIGARRCLQSGDTSRELRAGIPEGRGATRQFPPTPQRRGRSVLRPNALRRAPLLAHPLKLPPKQSWRWMWARPKSTPPGCARAPPKEDPAPGAASSVPRWRDRDLVATIAALADPSGRNSELCGSECECPQATVLASRANLSTRDVDKAAASGHLRR